MNKRVATSVETGARLATGSRVPHPRTTKVGIVIGVALTTAAGLAAATALRASASGKNTQGKTGYLLLVQEGPVCSRTSRFCREIPFAHALATVLRNGSAVASARLNARGRASVLVKALPGRYTLTARGTLNGGPFHLKVVMPRPVPGRMFPFAVNICAPGASC